MLEYPTRWDKDAVVRSIVSDFAELRVAATGSCTLSGGIAPPALGGYLIYSPGTSSDTVSMAYVGYGFQLFADTNANHGIGNLYLDGVLLGTVDSYSAAETFGVMLYQANSVPLGTHIVTLQATGTKDSSSSAFVISLQALKVMR